MNYSDSFASYMDHCARFLDIYTWKQEQYTSRSIATDMDKYHAIISRHAAIVTAATARDIRNAISSQRTQ